MKKTIAFSVFWLGLLVCSSRGTDLFHITADEQLAKFQDLFRSLLSKDTKSLSKTIDCFVLGTFQTKQTSGTLRSRQLYGLPYHSIEQL